ncbi:MAG: hypothetical protein K6B74_05960 [Ruminococcus sp.]|nr:hypothetical protein [Ruminococcus sp.]
MVNLVSEEYGYNDSLDGLYIFCGTAAEANTSPEQPEEPAAETELAPASDSKPAETAASEATISEANAANSEQPQKTGSVVGSGTMIMSCGLSAAVGALMLPSHTQKARVIISPSNIT